MGLMVLWGGAKNKMRMQTLNTQGVETEAVVQSKERRTETREETRSDGNGGQRVVGTYQVQVCALNLIFDADRSTDGVRCRVTAEKIGCSSEFYERTNAGQNVTVKYMPDEPRFFTTKGVGERDPRDGNAAILGILLSVIGAFVGYAGWSADGMPKVAPAAFAGVLLCSLLGIGSDLWRNRHSGGYDILILDGTSMEENPTDPIVTLADEAIPGSSEGRLAAEEMACATDANFSAAGAKDLDGGASQERLAAEATADPRNDCDLPQRPTNNF
jgi:hypothetical protein